MARECGKPVTASGCDRDWLARSIFPGSSSRADPASFITSFQWPFHRSEVVTHPALSWGSRAGPSMRSAQLHRRWIGLAYSKKVSLRLSLHRRILGTHCGIAGSAEGLTDILACCTAHLWKIQDTSKEAFPSAFYVDGHRRPVYTGVLIPRGLVGRLSAIIGNRALVLLHDATSDISYLP
jgi:hypothetical protein